MEGGALGATMVLSNGQRAWAAPGQWARSSKTVGSGEAAPGAVVQREGRLKRLSVLAGWSVRRPSFRPR